jgi:hypothetical protein
MERNYNIWVTLIKNYYLLQISPLKLCFEHMRPNLARVSIIMYFIVKICHKIYILKRNWLFDSVYRAVASIYSWGGGGGGRPTISEWRKKFPNISWHTKPQKCSYPENDDAIYKQKYGYYMHRHITEACSVIGSSFWLGGLKTRAEVPRKFLNSESLNCCHFLDFGEVLT